MGSLGNKVLSFVLASTIVLLGQVDCVPLLADLKDFNKQSNEAAVTKYFTVHQVTQLVRRRRDNVDHVQFPNVMTFDLEFEDSKIQLKLTKHDFMTGGVPLYDENGPIEHDLERKTGVYNNGAHGASFIVTCEDYNRHCTLQGSMMFGDEMWNISPDRNTEQLHKAVMRQNSNKKEFAGVLPPNRQGMEYEPKPQTDRYTISNQPSSRQRRAVPTDCDLVEAYAITDAELWRSYLSEESGNTTAAEAAIHSYFLSLYHQADRHFDLVGKIRNGSCIRLYLVGITIQKTNAESWSIPAEITIPGAIPAIAFVEAIAGLNSCGAIGNGLRGTLSISVDLFQCFTRKDIVWNENSGIPAYLAFYRSLAYKFSVCNPLFSPYQSDVIETLGDDVEVLLAKQIAGSIGTDYDSLNTAKGCSDNDFYVNTKETVVAPDVLKQRNVWYLSTCALDSIAAYLDSESVKCLRTSSISDAEYDAFFNQALAGTIYTWEKQCQNRFGENSTRCDPTGQNRTFFDEMCSAGITCTSNEFSDGSCTGVTRPFEGTQCGTFGSYCLKSECYILHGLGENCTAHERCSANNSFCDNLQDSTCRCLAEFYDDNGVNVIGGDCLPKVDVGESCPQPDACLDTNAICNGSQVCECLPGFYTENGKCFRLLCFGDSCNNTYQCQGDKVECLGLASTCRCNDDDYFDVATGNCVDKLQLGAVCEPGQCLTNYSVCGTLSGQCECQEDFFDSNNSTQLGGTCDPKIPLDAPCPFTGTCLDPNAECIVNCTCNSDFYNNAGTCEPQRCIGETCVDVTACSTSGAECSGTPLLCQCPTGTFLNETTNACDTNKVLGESCIPGSCGPANSVCDSTSNVCECQEGFYDSNNVTSAGTCESKISLDAPCPFAGTCLDPNAECTVNCTCKSDFYDNAGTCEPMRCIGDTCVDVTACSTTGAECSGTPLLCQCPTGTFLNETTNVCDTNKVLGESCIPGSCGPANSVCDSTSNVCECQEGFYDSNNVTSAGTCEAKIALDAPCPFAGTCLDPNAECIVNCTCKSDFYDNAGTCEPQRSIGETCVDVTACSTSGAECSGTPLLCQCPTGTFLNETTNACDTNKVLGESCIPGSCGPANSVCSSTSNVCECQEGFYDSNNVTTAGGTCDAKLSLGASCSQPDACSDPNSLCLSECRCNVGFYNNAGTCERQRSIGESCINVTACLTSGAECSGMPLTCRCPSLTFLNDETGTCDAAKALGDNCTAGQCGRNAICTPISGTCVCGDGFADTNGNGTCELSCPGNFVSNNTLGSCYLFGTTELFYSAARDLCSSFSTNSLTSSLVQVDDADELNYLKTTMLAASPQPDNGYWNDLFEVTTNGNERWRTTNTSLADTISDWRSPQPDDLNELQQCTMFFKAFGYEQADIECLDTEFPGGRDFRTAFALCEIKLP